MTRRPAPQNDAGAVSAAPVSTTGSVRRTIADGSEALGGITPIIPGGASYRRFVKMNRPEPPFTWFTREMLESPAWVAMPQAARRVLDRVMIEHMNHGGNRNGLLIVTYDDFARYGVRRRSIAQAIRTAVELGFLNVTTYGGRAYGVARRPSTYELTWLPRCDGTPASNRWKSVASRVPMSASEGTAEILGSR